MSFLLLNDLDLPFPSTLQHILCDWTYKHDISPPTLAFSTVFTWSSRNFCSQMGFFMLCVSHQTLEILNVHPQLKGFTVWMSEVFLKGAGPGFWGISQSTEQWQILLQNRNWSQVFFSPVFLMCSIYRDKISCLLTILCWSVRRMMDSAFNVSRALLKWRDHSTALDASVFRCMSPSRWRLQPRRLSCLRLN